MRVEETVDADVSDDGRFVILSAGCPGLLLPLEDEAGRPDGAARGCERLDHCGGPADCGARARSALLAPTRQLAFACKRSSGCDKPGPHRGSCGHANGPAKHPEQLVGCRLKTVDVQGVTWLGRVIALREGILYALYDASGDTGVRSIAFKDALYDTAAFDLVDRPKCVRPQLYIKTKARRHAPSLWYCQPQDGLSSMPFLYAQTRPHNTPACQPQSRFSITQARPPSFMATNHRTAGPTQTRPSDCPLPGATGPHGAPASAAADNKPSVSNATTPFSNATTPLLYRHQAFLQHKHFFLSTSRRVRYTTMTREYSDVDLKAAIAVESAVAGISARLQAEARQRLDRRGQGSEKETRPAPKRKRHDPKGALPDEQGNVPRGGKRPNSGRRKVGAAAAEAGVTGLAEEVRASYSLSLKYR